MPENTRKVMIPEVQQKLYVNQKCVNSHLLKLVTSQQKWSSFTLVNHELYKYIYNGLFDLDQRKHL